MNFYVFRRFSAVAVLFALSAYVNAASAKDSAGFAPWLREFERDAVSRGISPEVARDALQDAELLPTVIKLDRKQPEKKSTFTEYFKNVVNDARVREARQFYAQHRVELERIGVKYGVQPRFIVALWAIESNFGRNMGNFSIISSLATLAYEGRRADFFREELMLALQVVQEGHISSKQLIGSWAGAMGQCQFMPSSFLKFAVDENGDGIKDIWNTEVDVFGSVANYLATSGWDATQTWGRRVKLPAGFDSALAGREKMRPLHEWVGAGVTNADGSALPAEDIPAAVVIVGENERAYIVYGNFNVLMLWNRSTYFATAVGTLADRIAAKD